MFFIKGWAIVAIATMWEKTRLGRRSREVPSQSKL